MPRTKETAFGLWPTPTARDHRSGLASEATHERNSRPLNEQVCRNEEMGSLNPAWVEAMMGYPLGWTLTPEDGPSESGSAVSPA